jgi:flagellar assembly protein FliH
MGQAPKKFTFDRSFDTPKVSKVGAFIKPIDEPPPPPPPPTFSEAELAAARDEGYADGLNAGQRQAEATTERILAVALNSINGQLAQLSAAEKAAAEVAAADAMKVAVTVVRKLAPTLAKKGGLVEIESLLVDCLGRLEGEPKITVRVAPELSEHIEVRMNELIQKSAFEGKSLVLGDSSIPVGDCRLEWANGGAERNVERLWGEIESILADYIGETKTNQQNGIAAVAAVLDE